jgi:signal transduction histidine kinase
MKHSVSSVSQGLTEQYTSLLGAFVRNPTEALRDRAYQLATEAVANGHGVLDVTEAHREALLRMLSRASTPDESERIAGLASDFLLEMMVPFEMTHRGYRENVRYLNAANDALRKVRDELEDRVKARTAELADANGDLRAEIAERQRVEQERERLLEEVTELDRLKDQFIFVAAHELKTPVAIMKGYAEALLRMSGDIPVGQRNMLDAIDRGSDRIDRIVQDLLDISKILAGPLELRIERIDLAETVNAVVSRMASSNPKHQIRFVKADEIVVEGDRARLEQVLANYIDNAVKYSPNGGRVDVDLRVMESDAVVSVRDYSVGIPKSKQKRIFERFYRAHTRTPHDYGGMGVGLFLSKEIISRHRGRVWFESEEGKGSIFYFSLPLLS